MSVKQERTIEQQSDRDAKFKHRLGEVDELVHLNIGEIAWLGLGHILGELGVLLGIKAMLGEDRPCVGQQSPKGGRRRAKV